MEKCWLGDGINGWICILLIVHTSAALIYWLMATAFQNVLEGMKAIQVNWNVIALFCIEIISIHPKNMNWEK